MRVDKLLKLHKKSIAVLEMIARCDFLITENMEAEFKRKNGLSYYYMSPTYFKKRVSKYLAIQQRLIQYYADVMQRLVQPVIENMNHTIQMKVKLA